MARGANLSRLEQLVRAEARHNTSAAAGINASDHIRTIIARTYENLWREHDWPHLITWHQITLAAGQYLYAAPSTVTVERLIDKESYVHYPSLARRYPVMAHEIGFQQYNTLDPAETAGRTDPVQFWTIRPDEMIEVWPAPAIDGAILYLRGVRSVTALVSDADVAQLDDRLITLFAAAEIMGDKGMPKLKQAQALLAKLKGSLSHRRVFDMRGDDLANRTNLPAKHIEVIYTRA